LFSKSTLTDEEVKQKAKELQEYAHKQYKEKQRLLAEEQEKNRIRTSNIFLLKSLKLLNVSEGTR